VHQTVLYFGDTGPHVAVTTTFRSSLEWTRGPAVFDSGMLVRVPDIWKRISVLPSDAIDVEVSRIHSPDDAVAFIARFGFLAIRGFVAPFTDGEHNQTLNIPGTVIGNSTDNSNTAAEMPQRESFDLFATTAADIRDILRLMKDVRAALGTDDAALQALQRWSKGSPKFKATLDQRQRKQLVRDPFADESTSDFLRAVTDHVAERLNAGFIADARPPSLSVFGQPATAIDPRESPDRLTLSVACPTLRSFAYWTLAQKLISRNPIATCQECAHDFVVQVAGRERVQRFCTENCARRARYRETRKESAQ